jgi:hypothetical protein
MNNVTVYFNGSQVGSQQNMTGGTQALTFQLGSQMIVPAGQDSFIEVKADLQTTGNYAYSAGTATITNITTNIPADRGRGSTVSFSSLNSDEASVAVTFKVIVSFAVNHDSGSMSDTQFPDTILLNVVVTMLTPFLNQLNVTKNHVLFAVKFP